MGIVVEQSKVKAVALEQWIIPSDPPATIRAAARRPLRAAVAAAAVFAVVACDAVIASPREADLLAIVRRYADAMIRDGRDTYGAEHSPLFAAALDRHTGRLPDPQAFAAVEGVRDHDRSLCGANPQHDAPLYGILRELTRRTGDARYAAEADRALGFFLQRCASPKTALFAWGEHLTWDFREEKATWITEHHEIRMEWPHWDACYRLADGPSYAFALGQWDHQIFDPKTGDFSRHARWSEHGPEAGADFPRYAGQLILNWADAVGRPDGSGRPRRDELPQAIGVLVGRMEETLGQSPIGQLAAHRGAHYGWTASNLELARCLHKATEIAPPGSLSDELRSRMHRLAVELDRSVLRLQHTIHHGRDRGGHHGRDRGGHHGRDRGGHHGRDRGGHHGRDREGHHGGGFLVTFDVKTGQPIHRAQNPPFTTEWGHGYGVQASAAIANLLDERRAQLLETEPDIAESHRRLVVAAADRYLESDPDPAAEHAPEAFAEAIELLLRADALEGPQAAVRRHLARAVRLARTGIDLFLGDGLPWPKATSRHDHYEALTGGPAFMEALLRLDAALQRADPWAERAQPLREGMREDLGMPATRQPLEARVHRRLEGDGHSVECVTFAVDPGLRCTAAFYLPRPLPREPVPAIIVACGHGGSKSAAYAQYAGQLYAKLGFTVIVPDTIGEEERDHLGRLGSRGHDLPEMGDGHPEFVRRVLGRPVLGRIVQDLLAAVDYAASRPEVDASRIGLVGYSLGGTSGGCAAILDDRIRAAVIAGWVFSPRYTRPAEAKWCTVMPYEAFARRMDFAEMTALLAPHCATLFMLGDRDGIIDKANDGREAVRDLEAAVGGTEKILAVAGMRGTIRATIVPGADHRPFFLAADAVQFLQEHLNHRALPIPAGRRTFGNWADAEGVAIERLYDTPERERGLEVVDAGVRYRRPEELACFPGERPPLEYTMQGWIDGRTSAGLRDAQHLPRR